MLINVHIWLHYSYCTCVSWIYMHVSMHMSFYVMYMFICLYAYIICHLCVYVMYVYWPYNVYSTWCWYHIYTCCVGCIIRHILWYVYMCWFITWKILSYPPSVAYMKGKISTTNCNLPRSAGSRSWGCAFHISDATAERSNICNPVRYDSVIPWYFYLFLPHLPININQSVWAPQLVPKKV